MQFILILQNDTIKDIIYIKFKVRKTLYSHDYFLVLRHIIVIVKVRT